MTQLKTAKVENVTAVLLVQVKCDGCVDHWDSRNERHYTTDASYLEEETVRVPAILINEDEQIIIEEGVVYDNINTVGDVYDYELIDIED